MSGFGQVLGGAVLGTVASAGITALESVLLRPSLRGFYQNNNGPPILLPNCVIEEVSRDEIRITDHPVEYGSVISDHAYKEPCEVIVRYCWSNSSSLSGIVGQVTSNIMTIGAQALNQDVLSDIQGSIFSEGYCQEVMRQLVVLQASRQPFSLFTGKRQYQNMLLSSLGQTTTNNSEYALMTVIRCREVNIAYTSAAQIPAQAQQAQPINTAPVINAGAQQAQPATNTSGLAQIGSILGGSH